MCVNWSHFCQYCQKCPLKIMCSIDINDLASRLSRENGVKYVSHDENPSRKAVLYPPPRLHNASALHFASGAISGPISRTLTAPLDNLRLAIQVSPHKISLRESWAQLMSYGGIRGLWRGNGVNVFKVGPEMAIRFSVYDKIKTWFQSDPRNITTIQRFLSGATGGICGQLFIFPIDVLKTRMMVRLPGEFNGAFDALRKIYLREGMRAFYRGYASSVAGIIPYTGVDLSIYETLKNKFIFSKQEHNEKPADWKFLLCACVSITSGQYVSYPFYLVKSRQQARSKHASIIAIEQSKGCQLCKIFMLIIKQDGILGLYRGVILTLVKVLPAGVVNYIAYEHVRTHLTPYFE